MPPPLPRSSLSSLSRLPLCQTSTLSPRCFSTSTALSKIGPESPKFIEIPRTVQPHAHPHRDIKGTLPPPRNLFPKRYGAAISPGYVAAVKRKPSKKPKSAYKSAQPPHTTPRLAWEERMSVTRQQHLKESLIQLYRRKVRSDKVIAYQSSLKRQDREQRLHAPTREDERLTSPTITAAMRSLQLGNVPDPDRSARLAAAAANVAAKAAQLEERRRDALHSLYMQAREFIVTEQQLDAKIEAVFVERPWAHVPGKEQAVNIWDAEGAPPTVQDMLGELNGTQRTAVGFHGGAAVATGKRMLRVAEELTGGKMD